MDRIAEAPTLSAEDYLKRLPIVDQKNLKKISRLFQEALIKDGRRGALVVVGGTIDKPFPRKDIDVLMILQQDPRDPKKGSDSEFDFAQKDFQIFKKLIRTMISNDLSLIVKEENEPAIDEEFNSPGILKHDGSIVLQGPDKSLPVELVRRSERGAYQEIFANDKRHFVVLSDTA